MSTKTIPYNLTVDEKSHILLQLRIMKPTLSWKILETLYYVWKYPDTYENEIVENNLYKNRRTVSTSLQALYDQELLENETVDNKQDPSKFKKRKRLVLELSKNLFTDDVCITLNLKRK